MDLRFLPIYFEAKNLDDQWRKIHFYWDCNNILTNILHNFCIIFKIRLFFQKLEHTLFENVSKGPLFLWQTQIQTNEYGFNDIMQIKKKKERSYIDNSLTCILSHKFLTILMPKMTLAMFLSQKAGLLEPFFS